MQAYFVDQPIILPLKDISVIDEYSRSQDWVRCQELLPAAIYPFLIQRFFAGKDQGQIMICRAVFIQEMTFELVDEPESFLMFRATDGGAGAAGFVGF